MTPNQLKAARLLLSMTQGELAEAAKVARATINRFESGKTVGEGQVRLMQLAVEEAGVVLIPEGILIDGFTVIDGVGVRGDKP